jgi:UDP-3-O-[3-hydroxymyristoyl] glucosamine N-acyltransferase
MRTSAAACAAEASGKLVHPTARIAEGVVIEPGAVVGPQVTIGTGTTIAAGALVGFRVSLGRDCYVGAGASLTHAFVGNDVIIHAGVRIGQDGFGFAMSPKGIPRYPRLVA